jgi:fructokinase
MQQPQIFKLLRTEFAALLNGYVRHPDILERLDEFIQPPALGSRAGILGCLVLAEVEHAASTLDQAIRG